MAGKAVAVAKAAKVAKKPAVVAKAAKKPAVVAKAAKKPAAKATGKVVAKAAKKPATTKATGKATAKKPVATKATAKKPVVAKFNLNKLMMLIVRDAPKKGKKMMGGYIAADINNIKQQIVNFIHAHYKKIVEKIRKIEPTYNDIGDITLIGATNDTIIKIANDRTLSGELIGAALSNTSTDSEIYEQNFYTIVVALCKVYATFTTYTK